MVSGSVNTSQAGTYLITYRVSDVAGNIAIMTRTVTIYIPNGSAYASSPAVSIQPQETTIVPQIPNTVTPSIQPQSPESTIAMSDIDIFNPSITDGYCYTAKTGVNIVDSSSIVTNLEFKKSLVFMYAYELTKFDSVDRF